MSKKEKLRNEIKAAWDDLRYAEYKDGTHSYNTAYFRGVYDGLVRVWNILYGEEAKYYESK